VAAPSLTSRFADRPPTPLPKRSDLNRLPRLLYDAAVLNDYALRTSLATVLGTAMLPAAVRARGGDERRNLEFYAGLAASADPAEIFGPPEPVAVDARPGRNPGLAGGHVELLRFESAFQTINPALRERYARHRNNAVARAQHWRHVDGPRPTLCVIHGFGASPAWLNTAFFSLKQFFADGWDVLLYTLPFHGSRRTTTRNINGVDLFAHGMAQFCEAIRHGIHDFRAFLDHLFRAGAPRVGVTGLSLGGYHTALLAAVEPRLDFAIPNAAVTWLPPLLDSWFPADRTAAFSRRISGVTPELLADALALHSPLSYPPLLAKERLMVVAGLGDRLAPPEQSVALWEHWDRPQLHWFPGSHVIHLGRQAYLAAMRELLDADASTAS
jgi:pimeloyl-ACP methyl ester carboxylesterase